RVGSGSGRREKMEPENRGGRCRIWRERFGVFGICKEGDVQFFRLKGQSFYYEAVDSPPPDAVDIPPPDAVDSPPPDAVL
ncbi:MAG: hypothetical protein ACJA1W_001074, partial [Akkermansiaceae bacterium]